MAAALNDRLSDGNRISSHRSKVIDLLQLTLKVIILINGVAAVSLLTLVGSILSSGTGLDRVDLLTAAICAFSFGVLTGAIAVAKGYKQEHFTLEFEDNLEILDTKPELTDEQREKYIDNARSWGRLRRESKGEAEELLKGSYTLFGVGIVLCSLALLS